MGFPCNQFGNEPGAPLFIKRWYEDKYNVTFPIFDKVVVNGKGEHELFASIKNRKNYALSHFASWHEPEIQGDWTKFLIDQEGLPFERFEPDQAPNEM